MHNRRKLLKLANSALSLRLRRMYNMSNNKMRKQKPAKHKTLISNRSL